MEGKKKVLVVEDEASVHDMYRRQMGERIEFLSARSIEEGEQLFAEHQGQFDAIVMDACVPGDRPTTGPLVERFRAAFAGPIIATSGMEK